MGESHVIKSGQISLQSKGFMKSSWVKKFCVLHSGSQDCHPSMELFADKEAFMRSKSTGNPGQKSDSKKIKIDLHNVKNIKTSSKGRNEFIIELRIKRDKYTFMIESSGESVDWFNKLNATAAFSGSDENSASLSELNDGEEVTDNPMYDSSDQGSRFEVEVQETQLAKLCGIVGRKGMLISGNDMAFQDLYTKEINYNFGLVMMRRFGRKENVLSIEVGRKCANGEGQVVIKSEFTKSIHEILTKNAKGANSSSIKSTSGESKWQSESSQSGTSPEVVGDANISAPVMALNMQRVHPGQRGLQLVPLKPKPESDNELDAEVHVNDKEDLGTKNRVKSLKVSNDYRKELEEKLHTGPADQHPKKESKKESKSKKEEKKEKEKVEKDKGDHDKKQGKLKLFSKKDKKEEHKDAEKDADKGHSRKREVRNEYEEPDRDFTQHPPAQVTGENLYDEPIIGGNKAENRKSDHKSKSTKSDSHKKSPKESTLMSEPVEYAQPVKPGSGATAAGMYSDVKVARTDAWKSYGRAETEELHTEQYSSLKAAREQMQKAPPPVPFRQYIEEEDDDTYNRVNLRNSHSGTDREVVPADHIYGSASGAIGPLPEKILIPNTERSNSDSEGEVLYDDPEYDVCGNAEESRDTGPSGGEYEEAVVPTPPSPVRQPTLPKQSPPKPKDKGKSMPEESLYEDIR